jgi:hypothetical protein
LITKFAQFCKYVCRFNVNVNCVVADLTLSIGARNYMNLLEIFLFLPCSVRGHRVNNPVSGSVFTELSLFIDVTLLCL